MGKTYMFEREDLVNLLKNMKTYFHQRAQKFLKEEGGTLEQLTYKRSDEWINDFINDQIDKKAIRMEDLLDEADEIFKHTHGKTTMELAKDRKKNIN